VERRSGRKITAKGCYRDAVRSTKKHVIRCFGLKWMAMMLLVPVPWARRVGALPLLTTLCWSAKQRGQRRYKTSMDWVRQTMQQVRRWLPERRLVLLPVPVTAWYHKAEPPFADCLALVGRHLWRARYLVNSTPEGEFMPMPQAALDLLIHDVPLVA
jgi:hypothetical protein